MADETTEADFSPHNPQSRIEMLEVMALDNEYANMAEDAPFDLASMMFQVMAAELVSLREQIADLKLATVSLSALDAGLLDVPLATPTEDDDPMFHALREALRRQGLAIRQGALA